MLLMFWAGMLDFQHPHLKIAVPTAMCSSNPARFSWLAWKCYPFSPAHFYRGTILNLCTFCWTLNWMSFSVRQPEQMLFASWELFIPSHENKLTLQEELRSQRTVQWMLLTLLTLRPIFSCSRLPKVLSSLNATFHNSWAWTILAGCRFWTLLTFVCSDPPPTKGLALVGKISLIRHI